jgi:uncharacterized protein YfkK (UPF0435 family)
MRKNETHKEVLKQQTIALLVNGESINEISRRLNISNDVIQGWLKEESFKTALREASLEIYKLTVARLTSLLDRSFDEMARILDEGNDKNKIAVITKLYAIYDKLQDNDIETRLAKLETMITDDK